MMLPLFSMIWFLVSFILSLQLSVFAPFFSSFFVLFLLLPILFLQLPEQENRRSLEMRRMKFCSYIIATVLLLILTPESLGKPLGMSHLKNPSGTKNKGRPSSSPEETRQYLLKKNRRDALEIWPLSQSRHLMPLGSVWTEAFDQLSQVCFGRTEDITEEVPYCFLL